MSNTTAPAPEKLRPVKSMKYLFRGVLLCALVGLVCFFGGRMTAENREKSPHLDAVVLEAQLNQISQLATVSYHYTNMAQFENSNDFYGVAIPFTTKKFILTYDGEIKAGVDLSRAKITLSGEAVTVTLPAATILSHEIFEDTVEVFDEKTSIFNPFTIEDFSSFQADQKKAVEEKALNKGLLDEAARQARSSIQALLTPALPDRYQIVIQVK